MSWVVFCDLQFRHKVSQRMFLLMFYLANIVLLVNCFDEIADVNHLRYVSLLVTQVWETLDSRKLCINSTLD